jgi:hypothetical protein
MAGKRKHNKITGQWSARAIEMLESPAYRVMTRAALLALSRIEVELAHHGGQDNGKLPVTFDDFVEYGLSRASIGPALIELETLGFIKITERGEMARAAEYRKPNKFQLMTRPKGKNMGEQWPWQRFKTAEDAEAAVAEAKTEAELAAAARKEKPPVQNLNRRPVQFLN